MRAYLIAVLLALMAGSASAATALDGSCSGQVSSSGNPTCSLTTVSTNDVIVALAGSEVFHVSQGNGPAPGITVSGGGLTWSKRGEWSCDATVDCDGLGTLENGTKVSEWSAVAASPLSSQTITATVGGTFDNAGLIVFGVSGANTTTRWDAALPCEATINNFGSSSTSFQNVYTDNTAPFVITWLATTNNATSFSALPTGYSQIQFVTTVGGSAYYSSKAGYRVYTSVLNNATLTWGTGTTDRGEILVVDAICAASGACSGSTRSRCPNAPEIPMANRPQIWINE